MKIQRPFAAACLWRIILVSLLLLAGTGCSVLHNPFSHAPDLAGKWKNRHGTLWTLRPNGTFELSQHGVVSVSGSYAIAKRSGKYQMDLSFTGGTIPWDGHEPATYRIKLEKQTLDLAIVHDTCAARIAELSVKWKRLKP